MGKEMNIFNIIGWSLAVIFVSVLTAFFSYRFRLADDKKRWSFGVAWTFLSYLVVGSFCGLIYFILWLIEYGK
jgi:hypothetical protein